MRTSQSVDLQRTLGRHPEASSSNANRRWLGVATGLCCNAVMACGLMQMVCAAEPGSRNFSPGDVLGFEQPGSAQISPDGRHLVYAKLRRDPISDTRVTTLEYAPDLHAFAPLADAAGCTLAAWAPDSDRLALVCTRDGNTQLKVRDLRAGTDREIAKSAMPMSAPVWSPDGTRLAFQTFVPIPDPEMGKALSPIDGAHWAAPYRVIDRLFFQFDGIGILPNGYMQTFVAPADGSAAPRRLTDGVWWSLDGAGLAWTRDGSEVYLTASRRADWDRAPEAAAIYAIRVADGQVRTVSDRPGIAGMPLESPDGKWLAYLGADERGLSVQNERIRLRPRSGGAERVLLPALDRSFTSIVWAADSRALLASYEDQGQVRIARITLSGHFDVLASDVGGGAIELPFGGVFGGGEFSVARDGTIAYIRSSAAEPPQVALLDPRDRVSVVTSLDAEIKNAIGGFVPAQHLAVRSSIDGRPIDAWLLVPRGASTAHRAPIILDIHGGPFAAYGDRFSLKYQLFAAAGYAVLYANPRGSTGYGEAFANLIHDAWPGNDADDLLDAVSAVSQRSELDSNNVFATGTSGGATMTIVLATRGQRIRAGVAVKPITNWTSWMLDSDAGNFLYRQWFAGKLPWADSAAYWERSPLRLAPQVHAPLLLVAGDQDLRTPESDAIQMYTALKLLGKETELMLGPGVTHESARYRPSLFLQECNATLAWFERHRAAAGQ